MSRKIMVYIEGVSRCIVMTDDDESGYSDDLANNIEQAMTGNKTISLKTGTDILIVKPNKISAVHIEGGEFKVEENDPPAPLVHKNKKKKAKESLPEDFNVYDATDAVPELDLGEDDEDDENMEYEEDVAEEEIIDEEDSEDENDKDDNIVAEVDEWHNGIEE